jgi:putative flavoprotein involved in K+ transport
VQHTDTVIVGGGQAGLAMSRCLTDRNVEHVVLERGRIAERWRSERWNSLRLLTPNWQSRLPGFRYDGPDPDGFMGMAEVVGFFERYAGTFNAPVQGSTSVLSVERTDEKFLVRTTRGDWTARSVVIATGYSDIPHVPACASKISSRVLQVTPVQYREPSQLPEGGVLVVGASATGIQLAEEIHASGRPVTLAIGRHLRLPRTYRGRDILWWLDTMGIFDDTAERVADIRASRSQPSLQLVGRPDRRSLDVGMLRRQGVRLVGRLVAAAGGTVAVDDEAIATTVAADLKLAQLLTRIDAFIARTGLAGAVDPADPFEPTWPEVFDLEAQTLDLRSRGIATIVWATGFRRSYPWLKVPVLDPRGEITHRGGITPVPGLFVLGMHFQRRRKSAFIDGVGDDAQVLADEILRRAAATARTRSSAAALETRCATGASTWSIPLS